jgi:hypothetical protein
MDELIERQIITEVTDKVSSHIIARQPFVEAVLGLYLYLLYSARREGRVNPGNVINVLGPGEGNLIP